MSVGYNQAHGQQVASTDTYRERQEIAQMEKPNLRLYVCIAMQQSAGIGGLRD